MPQPAAPIVPVAIRLLAAADDMTDAFSAALVMVTAIQAAETPEDRHMIALRLMRLIKVNLRMDNVDIVLREQM